MSRVILVAKSRFLRKMLTGGFREASSWSKVDIFLEADGKECTVGVDCRRVAYSTMALHRASFLTSSADSIATSMVTSNRPSFR